MALTSRNRYVRYTVELGEKFCQAVETTPKSLSWICQSKTTFPSIQAVYRWIAAYPEFKARYELAKERQMLVMEEELRDIAYQDADDWLETKKGPRLNREAVERSKLKVQTLQWLMARLYPKRYSERAIGAGLEVNGPSEVVIRVIGAEKPEGGTPGAGA